MYQRWVFSSIGYSLTHSLSPQSLSLPPFSSLISTSAKNALITKLAEIIQSTLQMPIDNRNPDR